MSPSRHTIKELLSKYPFLVSFLEDNNVDYVGNEDKTLREIIDLLDKDEQEELAINIHQLEENLEMFVEQMAEFLSDDDEEVSSITIFPGTDKSGAPEKYKELELQSRLYKYHMGMREIVQNDNTRTILFFGGAAEENSIV